MNLNRKEDPQGDLGKLGKQQVEVKEEKKSDEYTGESKQKTEEGTVDEPEEREQLIIDKDKLDHYLSPLKKETLIILYSFIPKTKF